MINSRLSSHEVFHAAGGIEEYQEEEQEQGRIDRQNIAEQAGQTGHLRFDDMIAEQQRGHCEEQEDGVVGQHAAPIDRYVLLQSFRKQKIGLPEHRNEEDAHNLAQQNADNAEEGRQAERDDEVEHQLGPSRPYVGE